MPDREPSSATQTSPSTGRSAQTKAIIFDIGRVIVRVNLNRLLEPLAALVPNGGANRSGGRLSPQQVWQAIESDSRWNDWQEGRMTPAEWHRHLTSRFGIGISFEEFCAAWNRALDPQPMLEESLFETLAKRHKLALLSNTDPLHSTFLEEHFAFVKHFPIRIYSCSVGACKPSPVIFFAALKALEVAPSEALFIDDVEDFTAAAQRVGLDAIHFESPAQLAEQLARRDMLVP